MYWKYYKGFGKKPVINKKSSNKINPAPGTNTLRYVILFDAPKRVFLSRKEAFASGLFNQHEVF